MKAATTWRLRLRAALRYRQPMDAAWPAGLPLAHTQITGAVWILLGLGFTARLLRYLLRFPLWEDESFLAANYLERGFAGMLEPLLFHQVAPLGYLWIELALVKLLGFTEYTLRLWPLAAGLGSLALFAHLSHRLLHGGARLLAVALLAVSYPCIRYSAEAKPYGPDLFVSLVLLVLLVEWWRRPRHIGWLWALAAAAPLAVVLSYPALFVVGGVSLFSGLVLAARPRWKAWLPWLAMGVGSALAFLIVYQQSTRNQESAELAWMQAYWQQAMPPRHSATELVRWLAVTHTSDLMAFPVGGPRGASSLSALCAAVGLAVLWKRRQWGWLVLLLAPLGLNLLAAFLHRYPYGSHVKFAQYAAPGLCMLIGLGWAALLAATQRNAARMRRGLYASLGMLSALAVGVMVRDVTHPYKARSDAQARDFARWFWRDAACNGELVCLKTDLGLCFSAETYRELGWAATYLCNQRIYSRRHAAGMPPDWSRISAEWPLRCVQFRAGTWPFDQTAFENWLAQMQEQYQLVARDTYPLPRFDKRERRLLTIDYIDMFKFVPRRNASAGITRRRAEPHR
jgi:hypothetical protein